MNIYSLSASIPIVAVLYQFLKIYLRIMLYGFVKRISKINTDAMPFDKPTLVLANHPNSFFDAILLSIVCKQDLYYLVRGDLFRHPLANKWLRKLNMLPIHKAQLHDNNWRQQNDTTVQEIIALFKKGKHVVLFPEGNSHNDWYLQRLQKGGLTQITKAALAQNVHYNIQVMNITYNSFYYIPKSIIVAAQPVFSSKHFTSDKHTFDFDAFLAFVTQQMQSLFKPARATATSNHIVRKLTLAIPAFLGGILHYGYYALISNYVWRKTQGVRFYDSISLGIFVITYPILILFYAILLYYLTNQVALALTSCILIPFTLFCYIQLQPLKFGNRS